VLSSALRAAAGGRAKTREPRACIIRQQRDRDAERANVGQHACLAAFARSAHQDLGLIDGTDGHCLTDVRAHQILGVGVVGVVRIEQCDQYPRIERDHSGHSARRFSR